MSLGAGEPTRQGTRPEAPVGLGTGMEGPKDEPRDREVQTHWTDLGGEVECVDMVSSRVIVFLSFTIIHYSYYVVNVI